MVSPLEASAYLQYDASGSYLPLIHLAHQGASRALLGFMMRDVQVLSWLRSMKHFFLLDQVRSVLVI